jgi:hypothetical protein
MIDRAKAAVLVFTFSCAGVGAAGCTGDDTPAVDDGTARWDALMTDGDPTTIAPGSMMPPPGPGPMPGPGRFCPGDCSGSPLALWAFNDCGASPSTELADTAFTSAIPHPAFRAVSVACVPGIDGAAVKLAADEDIVYSPDQVDYVFDAGLTVAAWIKPDRVTGTQSIVRKRFDGSSSFVLGIDGRKLVFAIKLASGKTVGVSAPGLTAGKFTQVAATYNGSDAILYVDGVAAAKAHAVGKIAPGAGPIFVGNDASGRVMKGVVDNVWLNTLAAPASVVKDLTCIHQPAVANLTPAMSDPQTAGATVAFDLAVTNADGPNCAPSTFQYFASPFFPLLTDNAFGTLAVAPGQTGHATVNVRSSKQSQPGSYFVEVEVVPAATMAVPVSAQAVYVVGTGPISCDGTAPFTPNIIGGGSFGIAGGVFSFAASGLTLPVATAVTDPLTGAIQALQVSANPGVPTDAKNSFLGFGVGFGNPPCVDASAYNAVQFTITGDLGTCQPSLTLNPSENNATADSSVGVCTTPGGCFGPFSGPLTTGVNVVRFTDFTGGVPLATLDATAMNAITWNLTAPSDGVTAPCMASFTVTDVSFVNAN